MLSDFLTGTTKEPKRNIGKTHTTVRAETTQAVIATISSAATKNIIYFPFALNFAYYLHSARAKFILIIGITLSYKWIVRIIDARISWILCKM